MMVGFEVLSYSDIAEAFDIHELFFAHNPCFCAKCKWWYVYGDEDWNKDGLEDGFSVPEVKVDLFDLAGAPDLDGVPMFFFQECWEEVRRGANVVKTMMLKLRHPRKSCNKWAKESFGSDLGKELAQFLVLDQLEETKLSL